MDLSKIIDKIAKLRALSQSSNVHEAAAAASAAEKLIAEYRLSEADLEIESEKDEDMIDSEITEYGQNLSSWKCVLISGLNKHYGCAGYVTKARMRKHFSCGKKSDVELVKYMYSWLSLEIVRLSRDACKGEGKSASNSYCHGAVQGVLEAMQAEAARQRDQATSHALAVLDSRFNAAKAFMHSMHTIKGETNLGGARDAYAFQQGRVAGHRISRTKNVFSK